MVSFVTTYYKPLNHIHVGSHTSKKLVCSALIVALGLAGASIDNRKYFHKKI